MQIRTITVDDYERLIPFWKSNYFVSEMDSKKHFVLFLEKNPGLSILAEEEGKIAGTVLGSYDGRRGYLQKVVTRMELRRKGIGKQLVGEGIRRLKAVGAFYVQINVKEELMPFYEKCGFIKKDSFSMNIDL